MMRKNNCRNCEHGPCEWSCKMKCKKGNKWNDLPYGYRLYVGYIHYNRCEGDIEEVEVFAKNDTEAKRKTKEEAEANYEKGWKKITIKDARFAPGYIMTSSY